MASLICLKSSRCDMMLLYIFLTQIRHTGLALALGLGPCSGMVKKNSIHDSLNCWFSVYAFLGSSADDVTGLTIILIFSNVLHWYTTQFYKAIIDPDMIFLNALVGKSRVLYVLKTHWSDKSTPPMCSLWILMILGMMFGMCKEGACSKASYSN